MKTDGTGGWDRATSEITKDLEAEIDQAFDNVDVTIKAAGGKGWSQVSTSPHCHGRHLATDSRQVFRMTTYHVVLNEEVYLRMKKNIDKWLPDHKPIWTCVGVPKLAFPEMRVEIEVSAYDPK